MAFVHNPFYLVGAEVVVVSVLPDITKTITSITVTWQASGGGDQYESDDFHWKYNDFQCEIDENIDGETEYEFTVSVEYSDASNESVSTTFTTEPYVGGVSLPYSGTVSGSAQPSSLQQGQIEADADLIEGMWNKVGMPPHTVPVFFDSRHETAYCTQNIIAIGDGYATPGKYSEANRLGTYIHELRHYCGVSCVYGYDDRTIPHASKPFRDYDGIIKGVGASATLFDNYDYCIDDVAKFYFGSPVALINLNYEHSSFNNSLSYVDVFIHKALISTQSVVSPTRWTDSSVSRLNRYVPRVKIVGMDAWIDDAHKKNETYVTKLLWTDALKDYTLRMIGRPEDYADNLNRIETCVTYVYVGDRLSDSSSDNERIGSFYAKYAFGGGYPNLKNIVLNPHIKIFEGYTFQNDIYLESVTWLCTEAGCASSVGMFKGCTALTDFYIYNHNIPTRRSLFEVNSTAEVGKVPEGFTIHIPSDCNPEDWKLNTGGTHSAWYDYNIVPDL